MNEFPMCAQPMRAARAVWRALDPPRARVYRRRGRRVPVAVQMARLRAALRNRAARVTRPHHRAILASVARVEASGLAPSLARIYAQYLQFTLEDGAQHVTDRMVLNHLHHLARDGYLVQRPGRSLGRHGREPSTYHTPPNTATTPLVHATREVPA